MRETLTLAILINFSINFLRNFNLGVVTSMEDTAFENLLN